MKKTTKKTPSNASKKKAIRDLEVKPAQGKTVRGGPIYVQQKSWVE
jgi:hypothetical protein